MAGPGKAHALAELCGALALAGELSITSAMCSGDFTRAHQTLARRKKASSEAKHE
jgi:hydroxymethylglutaryl-CoA reductase (NADPH)